MHPFFASLNNQELMLLLTTLTVGGSKEAELFELLPEPSRSQLQEKAQALAGISAQQRVPLMVREMKQTLAMQGLQGAQRADPSWILHALRGESPQVVAAVLVNMPPAVVRSVLRRLPEAIREKLPSKRQVANIPAPVMRLIRQLFESRLHPMPPPPAKGFAFHNVIHLERAELYHLLHDLGLVELGKAFGAVGREALFDLCRKLPKPQAQELIAAAKQNAQGPEVDAQSAQRFLARVPANFSEPASYFQKAGLWRLAKASLPEDDSFRASLSQRVPRAAGLLLLEFATKVQGKSAAEGEEAPNLEPYRAVQDAILVRIKHLSHKGVLDARWQQTEFTYHDASAAEAMLAATTSGGQGNISPGTPAEGEHGSDAEA